MVLGETAAGADAGAMTSSSVHGLAESAIVKASTSTTSQRFSVSPIRSFLPADEPQMRRANTYHATGDEHKGGAIAHRGVAIRSAT